MQRDNKIQVLEAKLNGGVAVAASSTAKQNQQNNQPFGGKQREVGKVHKTEAQAKRAIIDGIKKPGAASAEKETPKSILKKPNQVKQNTPQRTTTIQTRPPMPAMPQKRPASRNSSEGRRPPISQNKKQIIDSAERRPPSRSSSQGGADLMVEVEDNNNMDDEEFYGAGKVPGEDDEPDMDPYGDEE